MALRRIVRTVSSSESERMYVGGSGASDASEKRRRADRGLRKRRILTILMGLSLVERVCLDMSSKRWWFVKFYLCRVRFMQLVIESDVFSRCTTCKALLGCLTYGDHVVSAQCFAGKRFALGATRWWKFVARVNGLKSNFHGRVGKTKEAEPSEVSVR